MKASQRPRRSTLADRVDHAVGVDDLRPDHLGPVVEVQPGVGLVLGQVRDEQDERAAQQRVLEDRRRVVGDEDVGRAASQSFISRPAGRDHVVARSSAWRPGRGSGGS